MLSIVQGTNRAVVCGEGSHLNIPCGTFIRFEDDDVFYSVHKSSRSYFISEFVRVDDFTICLNQDIGIELGPGDEVDLIVEEYAFDSLTRIVDSGTDYLEGDKLFIVGGDLAVTRGYSEACSFEVSRVESGGVKALNLLNAGRYLTFPKGPIELGGGNGSGAKIEGLFKASPQVQPLKRIIKEIERTRADGTIRLVHHLPPGMQSGRLSISKCSLLLSANYAGDTKVASKIEVVKDFTPNLKLPLLLRNSQSFVLVHNQALAMLDAKIKRLEEEIQALKALLGPVK